VIPLSPSLRGAVLMNSSCGALAIRLVPLFR
jgi:hypothetical protein